MFSPETIEYLKKAILEGRVSRGPADLQILPTTRCNASCIFCPTSAVSPAGKKQFAPRWLKPEMDINTGVLDRLADDLYRLGGLRRVHITGGEPLLFSKIGIMLFILRRTFPDVEISLVTNGILLERYAEMLALSGIARVSISLNAADAKSFAAQTKTAGSNFEKVKRGIKLLRKARDKRPGKKPYLSITTVLNRGNFRNVEKMTKLAISSGADALTYLALMDFPFPGETSREFALEQNEFDEFLEQLNNCRPLAEKRGIYLGFTGRVSDQGKLRAGGLYKKIRCYSGYSFVMVWPDGTVRPCCNCDTPLGNLSEQSFYQIWTSEHAQKIRERMLKITELGAPDSCDCLECGYLYENQEYHRLIGK